MILANYRDETAYYNILDLFVGGQISSKQFSSLITKCCMPMEIDLQTLEDAELNSVPVLPLVLVETKIFRDSEGVKTLEDFYVTSVLINSKLVLQAGVFCEVEKILGTFAFSSCSTHYHCRFVKIRHEGGQWF